MTLIKLSVSLCRADCTKNTKSKCWKSWSKILETFMWKFMCKKCWSPVEKCKKPQHKIVVVMSKYWDMENMEMFESCQSDIE